MKGLKYRTLVFDGMMDWLYGGGYFVEEIFIPQKKLCFNLDKGILRVFPSEDARENKGETELEVPDDVARSLGEFVKIESDLTHQKMELLDIILKDKILDVRNPVIPNKEKL